jgi:hypothetical protein
MPHVLWLWMGVLTSPHQQNCFCCFWTFWSTRTHFVVENSSVHIWQPIFDRSPPSSFLQTLKNALLHVRLFLMQTSSGVVIFTSCSLGTNGLQLNHTHNMSLPDLELQYDQVSAVLPIIQRKYSNTANIISIFLVRTFSKKRMKSRRDEV